MADGSAPLIQLAGVSYTYTAHRAAVLTAIDLTVTGGAYLLISGASGSGKSTLCRTFNGLIPHFYSGRLDGNVYVAGASTRDRKVVDLFDQVALVTQNPQAQLFNRTVVQELAFGLESLGLDRAAMHRRIADTAAALTITDLLPRNPQTLSGGQQQMVTIAAALVLRPKVLVLDEPLANLDGVHGRRLAAVLRQCRASGSAVVVCEHRLGTTLPDADRLVVLAEGRLRLDGPPQRILSTEHWLDDWGVELPLAVKVGRRRGLTPLPRRMTDLPPGIKIDADLLGPPPPAPATPGGPPVMRAAGLGLAVQGRWLVHAVDLTLGRGECVALVGANGAGKTTLLKLLGGLVRPTQGQVWLAEKETHRLAAPALAAAIGIAFQNPHNQFFKLTVSEELEVGPRALGRFDADWLAELVELFNLQDLLERSPFKLSGGEKKRVAFAAALAAQPAVLALDEPTAGQDSRFRRALAGAVEGLCRRGTAVLIITHALNFAEKVAHRWLVMAEGRLIAQGRPCELIADAALMAQAGLEPTDRYLGERS